MAYATATADRTLFEKVLECYTTKSPSKLLSLYTDIYAPSVKFTDPVVCAGPRGEARLQFLALQHVFSRVEAQPKAAPTRTEDGKVKMDVHFDYYWARSSAPAKWILPDTTPVEATLILTLDPSGKIVHHEDIWSAPGVPHIPLLLRSWNAYATNAMFRVLGWESELINEKHE